MFDFLRCVKNREMLERLMQVKGDHYNEISRDALKFIGSYIDLKKYGIMEDKGGKVDMRNGLDELIEWHEGIGLEKGLETGIRGFILDNFDRGESREVVKDKLIRYYELDPVKADEYLEKFIPVSVY